MLPHNAQTFVFSLLSQANLSTSLTFASYFTLPDRSLLRSTKESRKMVRGALISSIVPPVEALTACPIPSRFKKAMMNLVHFAPANTATYRHCNSETLRSRRLKDVRVLTISSIALNSSSGSPQLISEYL